MQMFETIKILHTTQTAYTIGEELHLFETIKILHTTQTAGLCFMLITDV